ncbi:unnamed protein product [Linum tenue]|uniref:Uncharacterized protein n=1 Tax=Linum tenue TaxID=586396 RepID=A0AAV0H5T3_9ROSI|nr:unnamed protein product [Linum tenue]
MSASRTPLRCSAPPLKLSPRKEERLKCLVLMRSPVEVTEENQDAAQAEKAKAVESLSEGVLSEAIDHLTDAALLNPTSAILYATRGSVYLKMKKPNAAIRDTSAALEEREALSALKEGNCFVFLVMIAFT